MQHWRSRSGSALALFILAACETQTSFKGGLDAIEGATTNTIIVDGLIVGGMCRPLCVGGAADPDGDGWGWENMQSCVVEGSPSAVGAVCSVTIPFSMVTEVDDLPSSNNFDNGLIQPPAKLPPVFQPGKTAERPTGNESTGFFVSEGRLFDGRGNEFVMRGINNPLAWFRGSPNAISWLSDIAATGSNAVRLVWEEQNNPPIDVLQQGIQRSIDLGMIPMVEMHDATGARDNASMLSLARYYASDAVAPVLRQFEQHLLLNIANEWSGADFANAYREAIDILRSAGLNHTIVIDSNGWAQNVGTLLEEAPGLLDYDPQRNLLFSLHMYERFSDPSDKPWGSQITTAIERALDAKIPLIVGEFGFQHGDDGTGKPRTVPFEALLDAANRYGVGYLGWSWTGNGQGVEYLDLVNRQTGAFTDWGRELVDGPSAEIAGIRGSSARSSMFTQ
jgi:mannan endo-1,4-beta-mannosidase